MDDYQPVICFETSDWNACSDSSDNIKHGLVSPSQAHLPLSSICLALALCRGPLPSVASTRPGVVLSFLPHRVIRGQAHKAPPFIPSTQPVLRYLLVEMFAKKALVLALLSLCLSAGAAPAADCVRASSQDLTCCIPHPLADYHANCYGEVVCYVCGARGG